MSSLAALVSRGGVFRFLWGCALFCVLCRRRRLALAFAPPLTKTGLWQWRDAAPCLPRRRACAYANLIAPRSGSCHRRGSSPRQMRTRHLQEQPVIYFCEKFEEHSLLASVLQPLAGPSSQSQNSARSPRTQLPAVGRVAWIINRPDAAVAPSPKGTQRAREALQ